MKKVWLFRIALIFSLSLSACAPSLPTLAPTESSTVSIPTAASTQTSISVSADQPCVGAPAPAQWHHVVVLMFENKQYDEVMGKAPYVTSLAQKCATAPSWNDANSKVDGSPDGHYNSKPNYATLTSGLAPSEHGINDDKYDVQTNVDNIYNQLNVAGLSFKDYYEAEAGGCDVHFSGDYHDPIRYYKDVASICDAHDVPLSTFMTDLNSGNLPAFSMIIPMKKHTMHDESIEVGDAFAKSVLDPLLNSSAYAEGDVAIFFLWDEDTPIPNVLMAPSIVPGAQVTVAKGNPISHFSALRTWEEMLGLPLIGDTKLAPSLLPIFNNASVIP